jgi:outer membrane autotransporter protein
VTANDLVKSGDGHVVLGEQGTPGRLVVAGSMTFADVTAGILSNNADLRAPVTVRSGATLGGNGRSMGVTILGGGRLAPGNSIDTYTTTSLTLSATSVYEVEFNADFADQIVVTDGPTVRAGQILVKFLGSAAQQNIRGKVFTIISNAGHAATGGFAAEDVAFDAATAALFPGYTPMVNLFDDRTDLYFLFRQNFGTPRTISSVPSIMGRTHSMFLRSIIGDPCSRLAARGPSTAQGLTLNSLLGSKNDIASMVSGAVDNSWVQGYGETISANQGSGQWGYDYQLGGVAAGLDLIRRPNSVVGLAFGLSQSDATHEYQGDRTTGTAYDFGLYAHAKHGEADFNFVAFFSKYAFNHTRQVDMEGSTKPAVGRPDAYRAGFALSYDVPVYADPESSAYLRLSFGGGVMNRSAFTETGDEAIAMRFDAVSTPYFQLDLGVGYGHDLFRSDKAWRIFGEAMLTRHLAIGQDEGVARFVTAYAGNTDTTLASP